MLTWCAGQGKHNKTLKTFPQSNNLKFLITLLFSKKLKEKLDFSVYIYIVPCFNIFISHLVDLRTVVEPLLQYELFSLDLFGCMLCCCHH